MILLFITNTLGLAAEVTEVSVTFRALATLLVLWVVSVLFVWVVLKILPVVKLALCRA